jgi:hypothetical protein
MTTLLSRTLAWPREVETAALDHLLAGLHGVVGGPIVIETIVVEREIQHYLAVSAPQVGALDAQLRAALPGLRANEVERTLPPLDQAFEVRLSTQRRPLVTAPEKSSSALIAVLTSLRRSEAVVLQWILIRRRTGLHLPSHAVGNAGEGWAQSLLKAPFIGVGQMDAADRRALQDKQGGPGWEAVGRIAVAASTAGRATAIARSVRGALRTAEGPGVRLGLRRTSPAKVRAASARSCRPMRLSLPEVLALSGWPVGVVPPSLKRAGHRPLPADRRIPRSGRIIGLGTAPGSERPLANSHEDARQGTLIVGPTGSGKSTLLLNLIEQDLREGRAVVVVDPKGDLVEDVLTRVPEDRLDDVVVLDPTDPEAPVGLAPLAGGQPDLRADALLGTFHSLYRDSWGPRTSDILHGSLLTLARAGEPLVGLPLLLMNDGYRRRLTATSSDTLGAGSLWAWYDSQSDEARAAAIAPVLNKVRAILTRPGLRAVLGQRHPRFDVRDVFTKRRVLLVSLARGRLGPETASLFGALVLSSIWQATLERAAVPTEQRHTVSLVVDEWQQVLHLPTDLADVLATARGLGLALHLANQHLGQLPRDLLAAALANARNKVFFGLSSEDARVVARSSRDLVAEDFEGLGAFEVYVKLLAGGSPTGWASARTLPPSRPQRQAIEARQRSRLRYGTPMSEVDAELSELLDSSGRERPIGRKRRSGGPS